MPGFNPNDITNVLDLDFSLDPRFTFGDLGVLRFADIAAEEVTIPLIPRDEWKDRCAAIEQQGGLEWLATRCMNQGNEGSCVGNATAQAMEVLQAKQNGTDAVVPISAMSIYKPISRSAQSGAVVSDALEQTRDVGCIPLDTPSNRERFGDFVLPHTGYSNKFPSGWETKAGWCKVQEWWRIRTVDQLVSVQLSGVPVVVGRSGHSIVYLRPFFKNNALCNLYLNSWALSFGVPAGNLTGGFGVDSEAKIRSSATSAFAPRVVTAEAA